MDRRRFLQSGIATAATVGLAGCPGGEGESTTTDRGAETDAGDAETDTPADTATETQSGETDTATDAETDSGPVELPRLRTEGSWIVTEDGERFTPRGANLIEPLFGDQNEAKRGGTYMDTLEMATDTANAWYNKFWNEPQEPGEDTLENWNAWKEVAQPLVDRIREDAPETPIIVGSPNWT